MLGHLVDDPRIEVSADESGAITLSVVSQDGGSIIGRRGQTLDALEHLVNRIVFRDDKAAPGRITIDVEGYRRRREESLRDLARRLGQKARETGQVVIVNPLSPRDRRIVHLELEADPNVTTRSEGEGLFRRLLIVPETGSTRR
ncbi:MAG TPA: R3H domain-containing nucleic acid-binding protein [Candidatus Binatia bacterium]|nr:R3H domain-containing nucleic acid-binding protein [Candidatus Binatia bacterium]